MTASWTRIALTGIGLGALALLVPGGAGAQPEAMPRACLDRLPTQPITLNLRDANVQTTLRLLAQQYRVNMVVTEEVTERATLDFFQVPARDIFRVIIESNRLRCVESGGVLRVSTAARFKTEEDERARVDEAKTRLEADTLKKLAEGRAAQAEFDEIKARGPLTDLAITVRRVDAEEVAKTLALYLRILPTGGPPPPAPAIYAPLPPTNIPSQAAPLAPPAPLLPPSAGETLGLGPEALAKFPSVSFHKPTNTVLVRYYKNLLPDIVKLVEKLDSVRSQVQIAAQMVITTRNALEQLGVQWGGAGVRPVGNTALVGQGFGTPLSNLTGLAAPQTGGTSVSGTFGSNPNFTGSGLLPVDPATGIPVGGNLVNLPTAFLPTLANPAFGLLFGIINKDFNVNLAIQALETQGKARSLAEPKTVTVENQTAEISRGFEVPFVSQSGFGGTNVQFKDALLRLEVTPNVFREDGTTKIRMKVVVENNEPDFTKAIQQNPPLFKRRNQTEVVVPEGGRLVIGGVMKEDTANTIRQVPVLGNIPVLGWLFKSREISSTGEELIVIITPSVVDTGSAAAR